jgi:hypothetical protein
VYMAHDFHYESHAEYGVVCRSNRVVNLYVNPSDTTEEFNDYLLRPPCHSLPSTTPKWNTPVQTAPRGPSERGVTGSMALMGSSVPGFKDCRWVTVD